MDNPKDKTSWIATTKRGNHFGFYLPVDSTPEAALQYARAIISKLIVNVEPRPDLDTPNIDEDTAERFCGHCGTTLDANGNCPTFGYLHEGKD